MKNIEQLLESYAIDKRLFDLERETQQLPTDAEQQKDQIRDAQSTAEKKGTGLDTLQRDRRKLVRATKADHTALQDREDEQRIRRPPTGG